MVVPVSLAYIDMIKAFRADCETLIGKFKNEKHNDAHTFIGLWKSLGFHLVYDDKYSKNGVEHDFKNDTLQIAKLIMLRDHFVGGTFLMFSLYCLQDCPQGTIRLDHEEYRQILRTLGLKDKNSTNSQLLKIFSILLKEDAFEFVAFSREYDMEGLHRAAMLYNNQYEIYDDEGPKLKDGPQGWLRNITNNSPNMTDLQNEYFRMKMRVKEEFPSLNLSLDMVQEDIVTSLLKALTQTDTIIKPPEVPDNIGTRRRSLKNRKMKIKYRYQLDGGGIDKECPSQGKKRKIGCPKGERKFFFKKAINYPEMDYDSDTRDSLGLDARKSPETKHDLPKIEN